MEGENRGAPLTVRDAGAALRSGETTSVELTTRVLALADELDPSLGTYLARFDEQALATAAARDEDLRSGRDLGPLHGIPVGVKDILAAVEGPTTAQSLVLDPSWGAGKDAPVVRRLRDAGAVITGKLTTMEFAVGMPDPSKPFPIPRNPWDLARWPGGSSSGSGSGVATGMFLAAIGTDTGGSIRLPAAYCGVSGLMPTYSLVPKSGCVPLGFTLDHIGPLARSAWDCAAVLAAIAGHDASDPVSTHRARPDYVNELDGDLDGVTIGVVRDPHLATATDDARDAYETAITALAALGADVREVTIPLYAEVTAASLVTMCAEAFAYHRRDMQRRWSDYFDRTRQLVGWGALVSGADYVQAQRVRRAGQLALASLFREVDVVLTPTTGAGAPRYDDILGADTMDMAGAIYTPYWDAVGNPVLAVPMGFDRDGLPLSMQLAARPFEEGVILRTGAAYQRATDWHLRVPTVVAHPVEEPATP